jgi:Holliday junction resolvase-like predicted endonuclease
VRDKDAESFEQSLRLLFAHIPYEIHVNSEAYYHSMFLLLMKMLGFDIQGQIMTNLGRIDTVWRQPELTVVAEVKYSAKKKANSLLNNAMKQIRDRRYYEKYADRNVLLLGIAFTGKDVKCRMEGIKNKQ